MLLLKNVFVLANFLILWDTFRFMATFFRLMGYFEAHLDSVNE